MKSSSNKHPESDRINNERYREFMVDFTIDKLPDLEINQNFNSVNPKEIQKQQPYDASLRAERESYLTNIPGIFCDEHSVVYPSILLPESKQVIEKKNRDILNYLPLHECKFYDIFKFGQKIFCHQSQVILTEDLWLENPNTVNNTTHLVCEADTTRAALKARGDNDKKSLTFMRKGSRGVIINFIKPKNAAVGGSAEIIPVVKFYSANHKQHIFPIYLSEDDLPLKLSYFLSIFDDFEFLCDYCVLDITTTPKLLLKTALTKAYSFNSIILTHRKHTFFNTIKDEQWQKILFEILYHQKDEIQQITKTLYSINPTFNFPIKLIPNIKVVIITQEINPFSQDVPTFLNIFRELNRTRFAVGCNIDITAWEKQGVLFINPLYINGEFAETPTPAQTHNGKQYSGAFAPRNDTHFVHENSRCENPGGFQTHNDEGCSQKIQCNRGVGHPVPGIWETLINIILKKLNMQKNLIFLLWGEGVFDKFNILNSKYNRIIMTPSPLVNEFVGCNCFKNVNNYLKMAGQKPVNWDLP